MHSKGKCYQQGPLHQQGALDQTASWGSLHNQVLAGGPHSHLPCPLLFFWQNKNGDAAGSSSAEDSSDDNNDNESSDEEAVDPETDSEEEDMDEETDENFQTMLRTALQAGNALVRPEITGVGAHGRLVKASVPCAAPGKCWRI